MSKRGSRIMRKLGYEIMPNKEREKKLYRMIPFIGLMYKTFGKYRKENMSYFEQSEKEIISWIARYI